MLTYRRHRRRLRRPADRFNRFTTYCDDAGSVPRITFQFGVTPESIRLEEARLQLPYLIRDAYGAAI
jgi:hypothetical protein